MADPVVTAVPAGQWTKVATNVTTGFIHRMISGEYLQTYRMTGEAAPTATTEGVKAFSESLVEEISASAGIDVYLYAVGSAGSVRVDVI